MTNTNAVLAGEIRDVIADAARGKGLRPHFLTAYQILHRLPSSTRARLIDTHGLVGKGAGNHVSAARVVADVIRHHLAAEVEVEYLDTQGVTFDVAEQKATAGYPVCGLYRLRPVDQEVE